MAEGIPERASKKGTWKTIRQGGLRGCILDTRFLPVDDPAIAFTKRERTRLVDDFDDISRCVKKWNYWMHRLLLVTLTLGADAFLQEHGFLEEPQDDIEEVGFLGGHLANGILERTGSIGYTSIQLIVKWRQAQMLADRLGTLYNALHLFYLFKSLCWIFVL